MNPEEIKKMHEMEERHFWFTSSRNIIKKVLKREKVNNGDLVLDIGCGTGGTIRAIDGKDWVIGADYDEIATEISKDSGIKKVVRANALFLPFRDKSFNFAFALDIIEHIENDMKVLNEINRILKDEGKLILTVPSFPSLYSTHDKALGHVRRYRKKELKKKLLMSGFFIKKCTYVNMTLFPLIAGVRLWKKRKLNEEAPKSDLFLPPHFINSLLQKIISFEGDIIKYSNLPFGLSLLVVAVKREKKL